MKKNQYLCTRFSSEESLLSEIALRFEENRLFFLYLHKLRFVSVVRKEKGYSGNRPYCRAGNRPEVFWKGTPENSRLDELLILGSFFYAPSVRVKIERLSKQ